MKHIQIVTNLGGIDVGGAAPTSILAKTTLINKIFL